MHHCSTVKQKVEWISQLLVPEPAHGLVSQLSRTHEVSRQTLYRWKEKGALALQAALEIRQIPPQRTMQVQEQVLTLLIEAHASYRDIQACLLKMSGIRISVGSITRIVQEAGKRAQQWLSQQQARTPRALALDEQYSSQRGKAYLNVVDVLELEAVLALLEEVREQALPSVQKEVVSLSKHLRLALPHLLLFAADLDAPPTASRPPIGTRRRALDCLGMATPCCAGSHH
jgi:hypothetical protein